MRPVPEQAKGELDQATPYLTFLPDMDEGFHLGYKATPGILSDHNQRPGEWLENFSKYIRTQGEDAGYSIPDVLAGEQQLRRLSRLPHDVAMGHQEMVDYRALLVLLLLWDLLAAAPGGASLTLENLLAPGESGGFSLAVRSALSPARTREGLEGFVLSRQQAENPEKTPLCLLSRAMVLIPAAHLCDLSQLLPPSVRWYRQKRFVDPCPYLDESMRTVLVPRLRLLQALNENAAAESPIYSPEAGLSALIGRLIADVLCQREAWRTRLSANDPQAVQDLRTRVLAVYVLGKRDRQLRLTMGALSGIGAENNPLLRLLVVPGKEPSVPQGEEEALYFMTGEPFARQSAAYLLEPSEAPGERAALEKLQKEIALLDRYDEGWRQEAGSALQALQERMSARTGFNAGVLALLGQWAAEYKAAPSYSDWEAVLRYPEDGEAQTLSPLLSNILGPEAAACVQAPFSHCLLLVEGCEATPFGCLPENPCQVEGEKLFFAPPLSPEMAEFLEAQSEKDDPAAPRLLPESLFCRPTADGSGMEAGFSLVCRVRDENGDVPGKVAFLRTYPLRTLPESGGAFRIAAASLPCATLWPNARLSAGRWRQYYIHVHRPEAVDLWALSSNGFVQGQLHSVQAEGRERGPGRSWRTLCTDRFPVYAVLKRGTLSLGVLANTKPAEVLRREDPAVISLDFGSISTTVMMRQGEKIQPAVMPRPLHGSLLMADPADRRFLEEEFLPQDVLSPQKGSTCYSVMDMFSDAPESWQGVLRDGHIFYPASLAALMQKGENTLYYDLKWSEEDYVLRCLRLFLKQCMVQASLSARLWGSPSLAWRVSMPNALPPHRQEAYLALMRGLAHEVAEESGVPLTAGCPPVLYAAENQADGLYFRSRNEVNARCGYLNLDLGGGTADISLWLNNAIHATAECSLLLGCRHILYASVAAGHIQDFEADFAGEDTPMGRSAREIAALLRERAATTRGQQKGMLLMDDFFAAYAPEIRAAMAAARTQGKMTYTEALLLFNIGFLFHLCGLMLQRAYQQEELRPLLPKRLEICIAGNGGQLLLAFSREQINNLCGLALETLCREHPVAALLPVQSADPKREVALGLLSDAGGLQSALQRVDRWNGTLPAPAPGEWAKPVTDYLRRFCRAFPMAANRLLGGVLEAGGTQDGPRLSSAARMELETILENERYASPEDDFTAYTRCFTGLKRLWRI